MHPKIAFCFPQFTIGGEAVTGHDPVHWHDGALCHPPLRIFVGEEESPGIPDRPGDAEEAGRRKRPQLGPLPPNGPGKTGLIARPYPVSTGATAIPQPRETGRQIASGSRTFRNTHPKRWDLTDFPPEPYNPLRPTAVTAPVLHRTRKAGR